MLNEYVVKNNERLSYRIIDGEAVVVNLTDSVFHTLNPVATFIWQHIDGHTMVKDIVSRISSDFDIDPFTAEKDCVEFISELVRKNLLSLSPTPVTES
jgi:hypothetical protein